MAQAQAQAIDMRGELKDDPESIHLMDHPDSTEEIPTLDMGPYLADTPGGREEVARRLREISRTIGFFYLAGHGIPQEAIDAVFAQSRRFHEQADEDKDAIPVIANGTFKSGYRRMMDEDRAKANVNIISGAKPNLYSSYTFNREGGSGGLDMSAEEGAKVINVWPQNLPGFKEAVRKYHQDVEQLARQFLPLWATSLDLPLDYFDKYFVAPHCQLALSHYPPQKAIGTRQYGIAPHTDNSMMTFLAQANVPGLAVRMPSGHWRLVDIVPGTLLVNTGNAIVRWTNNEYLSTKHRVINTNEVDRYSIPVFFGPSADALLEVLPTCQGPDRPPLYEPMTYGDMRKWYYGTA